LPSYIEEEKQRPLSDARQRGEFAVEHTPTAKGRGEERGEKERRKGRRGEEGGSEENGEEGGRKKGQGAATSARGVIQHRV